MRDRGVSRVFVQDDFRLRVMGLSTLAVRLCGQFYMEFDRSRGRRGTRGVNTDFLIIFWVVYSPTISFHLTLSRCIKFLITTLREGGMDRQKGEHLTEMDNKEKGESESTGPHIACVIFLFKDIRGEINI